MLHKTILISLAGIAYIAMPAFGVTPVFDATAAGKLGEQLNTAKEGIDELKKHSEKMQSVINSVGDVTKFKVLNVASVQGAIQDLVSSSSCLIPDYSKLLPTVKNVDLDFGSICKAKEFYKDQLFFDSGTYTGNLKPSRKMAHAGRTRGRVYIDTALKGLGNSETGNNHIVSLRDASAEISAKARSAQSTNEQLAVTNQALAAMLAGQAAQLELLSSLLRITAMEAVMKTDVRQEFEISDRERAEAEAEAAQ